MDELIVSIFSDNHNHSLVTPLKRMYLRTRRVIPSSSHELFKSLKACNISLSKQFAIASAKYGGYESMTFS